MSQTIKKALIDARARLIFFRELSRCAAELGEITLKPQEFWEPEDQAAIGLLDRAIAEANREKPLFEVVS